MENVLFNLYSPHKLEDEELFPFTDESGFSLVALYPENEKPDKRMFLKLHLKDGQVFGGVQIVRKLDDSSGGYPLVDTGKGEKTVTNFNLTVEDNFFFDEVEKIILNKNNNKKYVIQDFVEKIKENHLRPESVCLKYYKNISLVVLLFVFWLVERDYRSAEHHLLLRSKEYAEKNRVEVNDVEPVFRYFKISKNILLCFCFLYILIILYTYLLDNNFSIPDVTNSLFIASLAFSLFLLERLTSFLVKSIKDFNQGESCWIARIENYRYGFGFKIKLDI